MSTTSNSMQKKNIFSLIVISVISLFYISLRANNAFVDNRNNYSQQTSNQKGSTLPAKTGLNIDGYYISWFEVNDVRKISLFTNLQQKETSEKIAIQHDCIYLVSAGFYGKDYKHIGLFISDNNKLSDAIASKMFDGFFYIKDNKAFISNEPNLDSDIALQSGPLLIKGNSNLDKNFANKEKSRRILVATSNSGSVIFMVLFSENRLQGPSLSEITNIVNKLEKYLGIDILDLLNLDGGAHSVFLTPDQKITEVSPIGSFFCISE